MVKIPRKIKIFCLIFSVFVFFAGCEVESQNPLSSITEAKIDKQLLGKWKVVDGKKNEYMHVEKLSSHELKIPFEGEDLDEEDKDSFFTVFVSEIAGNKYMNVRAVNPSKGSSGYIFLKYIVKDNKLTLWILNGYKVQEGLKKGLLKGEARGIFGGANISDTSSNLKRFIESSTDSELFEYLAQFEKVN
jgi:hypothetical protein